MKIAVLGCGSIGQRHIRNLRTIGVERIATYDPDPARQAEAAALGALIHATPAAAIAGSTAVVICTPPAQHGSDIRGAIAAGADVFVEKPIGTDLADIDRAIAAATAARRIVQVGYCFRSEAGLEATRREIESGAIGRVLAVRAEFGQFLPDWRPSRDYRAGYNASAALGGGVLFDQSHEIDYIRWLCGEPNSVIAASAHTSDLAIDVEDVAAITLRLVSGGIAEIHVDSVRRDYRRACAFIGTEGTLEWDLRTGARVFTPAGGWRTIASASEVNAMYLAEMRAFLTAVRERTPPIVDAVDGRRTLEVVLAAKRAAIEGRAVAV